MPESSLIVFLFQNMGANNFCQMIVSKKDRKCKDKLPIEVSDREIEPTHFSLSKL